MKAGIIYTSTTPELIELVNREVRKNLGEDAQIQSYEDPSILAEVREAGYVTSKAAARLVAMFMQAVIDGADAVPGTLRILNEKIRDHELEKSYLCVTVGRPQPAAGKIEGFLTKDESQKLVTFHRRPVPGGKTAVTLYETLETRGELSLVRCRLLTGRTHQIRVSMAALGCPLLGDGKYGKGEVNRRYQETRQALYAYQLAFSLPMDAGMLNYLRGRTFTVEDVPFREKYFPAR